MIGAPGEETVLVTGVAHGIGRATAERLAADGYRVIGVDIEANGPACLADFLRIDLADHGPAAEALGRLARSQPILRLVNNVGSSKRELLKDGDGSAQQWLSRLNIGSALLCLQALLPGMRAARFGRVVNLTSRASYGRETRSAYAATKSGLAAATRSWARELAGDGITVNAVGPGMIDTELLRRNNPAGAPDVDRLRNNIPMRRVGEAGEVAQAVAFFLDTRSGYVTGQMLMVCGGLSLGIFGRREAARQTPETAPQGG
ncbi:SDR family oxidoreductase [Afifella sp. IM 167]|uniref:SDR family oxidoreductase n=1 Tax=Afifella sp. IM 167 TaxID=2033586 RepID=UPI001CCE134B|nr:SDR family oxidoreductase [Afifella sp. IM 167]MBZ8132394.1 short-chain dehydrogenase [Afifella sp. IM 167]